MPAESADTPFAEAAGVQKQQSQAPSEALEETETSADLDTETASTLAPSTTFKSELGDSDSGVLTPQRLLSLALRRIEPEFAIACVVTAWLRSDLSVEYACAP